MTTQPSQISILVWVNNQRAKHLATAQKYQGLHAVASSTIHSAI